MCRASWSQIGMHHLLFPLRLRLRPRAGSLLSSGSLFVQNRRAPTSLEGERAKRRGVPSHFAVDTSPTAAVDNLRPRSEPHKRSFVHAFAVLSSSGDRPPRAQSPHQLTVSGERVRLVSGEGRRVSSAAAVGVSTALPRLDRRAPAQHSLDTGCGARDEHGGRTPPPRGRSRPDTHSAR
jgi:hypothetical protein